MEFAIQGETAGISLIRGDHGETAGFMITTTLPLIFLAMATALGWLWQRRKADRKSGLPGDWGLPFLGETLTYVAKMKTPLGNFVDLKAKRYVMDHQSQASSPKFMTCCKECVENHVNSPKFGK